MSGIIALDIAISLIFIFLIYSLLASSLNEMIASLLRLRAKMLRKAISRLLDKEEIKTQLAGWIKLSWIWLTRKGTGEKVARFSDDMYDYPLIKKLGKSSKRKPSYLDRRFFAISLYDLISEKDKSKSFKKNLEAIDTIDEDTKKLIRRLYDQFKNDQEKIITELGDWYDIYMQRVTGWYKKQSQRIIFFIGLVIAFAFNVDTISMVNMLSNNDKIRNEMVALASAYIEAGSNNFNSDTIHMVSDTNNPDSTAMIIIDPVTDSIYKEIVDMLEGDIYKVNHTMALGWAFPDSVGDTLAYEQHRPNKKEYLLYKKWVGRKAGILNKKHKTRFTFCHKVGMAICMVFTSTKLLGFLLTAIALSLGSSFWFDLLNKIMRLRVSGVKPDSGEQSRKSSKNKK